jgi:hypothetical protein
MIGDIMSLNLILSGLILVSMIKLSIQARGQRFDQQTRGFEKVTSTLSIFLYIFIYREVSLYVCEFKAPQFFFC